MWRNGETVTVLRVGPRDRYGDGGGFDVSHTISNVVIKWTDVDELEDQREASVSDVTLFCPFGADILASDRVQLPDGDEYFVNGKPARPTSPFSGRKPYVAVKLRAVV